jgi:hypothetical protein
MCQNYMRSTEKIKSQKSFSFTYRYVKNSNHAFVQSYNHPRYETSQEFPGEQVSGSLEVSTLKKLFSSLNLRAIKKSVKRKFM